MKNYLKEVVLIFLACSNIDLYAKTENTAAQKSEFNELPIAGIDSNTNATNNKLYLLLLLAAITICYAFYKWRIYKKNHY